MYFSHCGGGPQTSCINKLLDGHHIRVLCIRAHMIYGRLRWKRKENKNERAVIEYENSIRRGRSRFSRYRIKSLLRHRIDMRGAWGFPSAYAAPRRLFKARCTSYPYFSRASTACVRLKPIEHNCLTGSTSSSTDGVTVPAGSLTGARSCGGGTGGGSCFDFFLSFLPKGRRICEVDESMV